MKIVTKSGAVEAADASREDLLSALAVMASQLSQGNGAVQSLTEKLFKAECEVQRLHVLLDMAEAA